MVLVHVTEPTQKQDKNIILKTFIILFVHMHDYTTN